MRLKTLFLLELSGKLGGVTVDQAGERGFAGTPGAQQLADPSNLNPPSSVNKHSLVPKKSTWRRNTEGRARNRGQAGSGATSGARCAGLSRCALALDPTHHPARSRAPPKGTCEDRGAVVHGAASMEATEGDH